MFIPIGDDNTKRIRFPFITLMLIGLNAMMFYLELQRGDTFVQNWSVIPAEFTSGSFPVITLFTAMFMHGGWAHLLGNMVYLYVFGDNVEDNLGHGKFLLFYLLAGIAAAFAQIFFNPDSTVPNLGASGAIAGVLGAYLVLYPRNHVRVLMGWFVMRVGAWFVLGLWALTQFFAASTSVFDTAQSEQGGIAYMAHVGGFVAGVILVLIFRTRQATRGLEERLHHTR